MTCDEQHLNTAHAAWWGSAAATAAAKAEAGIASSLMPAAAKNNKRGKRKANGSGYSTDGGMSCDHTPAAKSMPASQTSEAGVAAWPLVTSGATQHAEASGLLLVDDAWDNMLRAARGRRRRLSSGWSRAFRNLLRVKYILVLDGAART
jgi:hypothetical protein